MPVLGGRSGIKVVIVYQDASGKWRRYQEINHEANALRTASARAKSTGKRHRLVDSSGSPFKFNINNETNIRIILNVEDGIKTLLSAMAKKEEIDGVSIDTYSNLPSSLTGIIAYFVVKGLKSEFNLEFT